MKRRDYESGPTRTVGYGYVGRWLGGDLGWSMPDCVGGCCGGTARPTPRDWNTGEPHYYCRITIEQVFRSDGRAIVHYPGGKPSNDNGGAS